MNFKTETVSAVPKSVLNLKIYPVIELMAYLVNFFFWLGEVIDDRWLRGTQNPSDQKMLLLPFSH
jgi:hypothetical protein